MVISTQCRSVTCVQLRTLSNFEDFSRRNVEISVYVSLRLQVECRWMQHTHGCDVVFGQQQRLPSVQDDRRAPKRWAVERQRLIFAALTTDVTAISPA